MSVPQVTGKRTLGRNGCVFWSSRSVTRASRSDTSPVAFATSQIRPLNASCQHWQLSAASLRKKSGRPCNWQVVGILWMAVSLCPVLGTPEWVTPIFTTSGDSQEPTTALETLASLSDFWAFLLSSGLWSERQPWKYVFFLTKPFLSQPPLVIPEDTHKTLIAGTSPIAQLSSRANMLPWDPADGWTHGI